MTSVRTLSQVLVKIDEQELDSALAETLTCVNVYQHVDQSTCCEMVFTAQLAMSLKAPAIGKTVFIAFPGESELLFSGEVTAFRHKYAEAGVEQLVVRCYDRSHRLRKIQHLRQFDSLSLAEALESLLAEHDIQLVYEAETKKLDQRFQWHQSDWSFLLETIQRYGLSCFFTSDMLYVYSHKGRNEAAINIERRQLRSLEIECNSEPACRSVSVLGWDPHKALSISASADTGANSSVADDVTNPAAISISGERIMSGQRCSDSEDAESIGSAMVWQRQSAEIIVEGRLTGSSQLQPGREINLDELSIDLLQDVGLVLTQVTHQIDSEHGYIATISTQPTEPLKRRKMISSMGVVSEVDDPEKMGRVKVRYPELGMLESQWLEVVQTAAGAGKGLVALPDKDDKVLVLFVDGDPVDGIVVGGLFSDTQAPEFGVHNGRIKQYTFVTPKGQKITLDDKRKRLKIENNEGSYLELSPNGVHLFSRRDLTIEAPGKAMTIAADTIDFVQKS